MVITNTWTVTPSFSRTATWTWTRTNTQIITNTQTATPSFTGTPTNSQQPTTSFTATPTITQPENQQLTISNVIIYPNPYNPDNPDEGNLKIRFEITQKCKIIKVRIYTTGFRLIKQITQTENYGVGTNDVKIENRYLKDLANGVYYILIEVMNTKGGKTQSKPEVLVILK